MMFKRLELLTLGRFLLLTILFLPSGIPGSLTVAQSISSPLQFGPTADFDWSMPERFGPEDKNGLVDYHWDPSTRTYPSTFVNPQTWRVNFKACEGSERPSGIRSYTWEVLGQSFVVTDSCNFSYEKFKTLGVYPVKLTVTDLDGQTTSIQKDITLKDLLIVSIGDSFASGQGNPDIERDDRRKAQWVDVECHRSANAGPAKAALRIERADPHTSVTFISYACSGARIRELVTSEQKKGRKGLAPQIRRLRKAISGRRIDALLISIGGNDVSFSRLVTRTIVKKNAAEDDKTNELLEEGLETLEAKYRELNDEIARLFPTPQVFITEYPDLVRDADGNFCGEAPPDDFLLQRISCPEARWASETVITRLNEKVAEAALRHNWVYVGEVASRFLKHGYCAGAEHWVNTFKDAERRQGRTKCLKTSLADCIISPGSVHPNNQGHDCYATRILQTLQTRNVITSAVLTSPDDLCAAPSTPSVPKECP
jgi:lysophospholipase L1-like esterase